VKFSRLMRIVHSAPLLSGMLATVVIAIATVTVSHASEGSAEPASAARQTVAARVDCSSLAGVDLTDIGGTGSRIASSKRTTQSGGEFCEVEGRLAPSIGFKVVLPVAGWTQRYLQVGCGGLCGRIGMEVGAADGCVPLNQGGFVVAATDMGHQGMAPEFGRDPQQRVDFAYRSVHLTALASKKLIKAYYGQQEAFSYFTGCSDGGREALMEAQRYPQDFNGIIAGAPAMLFQFQNSLHHGWLAASNTGDDGKPVLTASRLPILHKAVLAACDGLDGQVDGLITDPRVCHFNPETVQCPAGATDKSSCLSAREVAVAARIYAGATDAQTGEYLTVGSAQYGSELGWAGVFVPRTDKEPIFSTLIALGALKNLIFAQDPPDSYALSDLQFSKKTVDLLKARHPLFDATNPDLSAFRNAGGKLILWHGWSDEHISPLTTIAYHEAVQQQMGKTVVDSFERLYLLPGVQHCGRGEGPSAIDLLTPMLNWVERGQAPDSVVARAATERNDFGQPMAEGPGKPAGALAASLPKPSSRSRPVFPYPAVAKYSGSGNPDEASSYVRGEPLAGKTARAWVGEEFFRPYAPSMQ